MMRSFIFVFLFTLGACEALPTSYSAKPETTKTLDVNQKQVVLSTPVTDTQRATFGILTDLIGQRFYGLPSNGSTERKADFQEWQWALGGSAILIRHALEDGSYGGDTYIYEDAQTETLVYVYITNAGFRTEGSIELNGDAGFTAEEAVTGHPTITKVRSTSSFRDDGSIHVASELFQDGSWASGHAFTYTQTDTPPMLKSVSDDTAER